MCNIEENKKQITKKQHYVPQFYLKRFTDKNGFLQVYNCNKCEFLKSYPKDICFEKFLYETEIKENGRNTKKYFNLNETEKSLNKKETEWNIVINSLIEKYDTISSSAPVITQNEKRILAEFVATMYYRHPSTMIKNLNFVADDKHLKDINVYPNSMGYHLLKSPNYQAMLISKIKEINLFQYHDFGDVYTMAKDLNSMNFTILKINKRNFITSSFPVISMFRDDIPSEKILQIILPISSQYALMFTNMNLNSNFKDKVYYMTDIDTFKLNFQYFVYDRELCEYIFSNNKEDLEEYYKKLQSYL